MTHMGNFLDEVERQLTAIVERYERSAPTVSAWADDLYIRLREQPNRVILTELLPLNHFVVGGQWLHPNHAANMIYKLQHRLGQDVTGHAGY